VLFCVQDLASRFIIHAHLKESPIEFVEKSFGFPHWFKLDKCFKDAFHFQEKLGRYGRPITFYLDSDIHHSYKKKLLGDVWYQLPIGLKNHYLLSPLDAFFGRLQFEFRKDLTQSNLRKWIHYYNFERKHSTLNQTPSSIFFDNSKEYYANLKLSL
jgi:transposase InsO family protein